MEEIFPEKIVGELKGAVQVEKLKKVVDVVELEKMMAQQEL